jgi:hypothetical protein
MIPVTYVVYFIFLQNVNDDAFIDVKQEEISEPFSFVSVKVRIDEC